MIRVNEDYFIDSDRHKVSINKKTGEETPMYETLGYFGSLEGALKKIKDHMIKSQLASDVYGL